jgi:hypothetical protein
VLVVMSLLLAATTAAAADDLLAVLGWLLLVVLSAVNNVSGLLNASESLNRHIINVNQIPTQPQSNVI